MNLEIVIQVYVKSHPTEPFHTL